MAIARPPPFRPCFRARKSNARLQLQQQIARRSYASNVHKPVPPGGNRVWALGALAVAVPACWYLLRKDSDNVAAPLETAYDRNKGYGKEDSKQAEVTKFTNKDEAKDKADPFKPAGSQNSQSGKQEGLSNADTRHSSDVTRPGLSKKGEGTPESAKAKGTVDIQRPQV